MIVSASYRTDIPALYGPWFLRRLAAVYCVVPNPYGGPATRVSLAPGDVDGFVFWTRNVKPFLGALDEIGRRRIPFVLQMTITGYPRAIEAAVPPAAAALAQLRAIARRFGPRAAVWRYDPILLTTDMTADWHRRNFALLAAGAAGATDEVVVSFADFYAKTRRNLERAAAAHGFGWRDPDDGEKRALLADLAAIAGDRGLRLTLCTEPALVDGAFPAARCIDAARLSAVAGRTIAARRKGNRPGCDCAESRDIGVYDSCPQGCAYCYAVRDPAAAKRRRRDHDAAGESLLPLAGRQAASDLAMPTRAGRSRRSCSSQPASTT